MRMENKEEKLNIKAIIMLICSMSQRKIESNVRKKKLRLLVEYVVKK